MTTKTFAVGVINFFDNELIIEIVEAEDWKSALSLHSEVDSSDLVLEASSLEEAKSLAFDADSAIDVVEVLIK